jgi:hypothetical protein
VLAIDEARAIVGALAIDPDVALAKKLQEAAAADQVLERRAWLYPTSRAVCSARAVSHGVPVSSQSEGR